VLGSEYVVRRLSWDEILAYYRQTLLSVNRQEVMAVLQKYFGQEDYVLAMVD
jgi:hypothetical protein